ncbi:histone-lysine N-methyltransferase ASHR3 isoform X1 [Elaeis guineensis]|uniref:Histone-lysine N-methyltransferase ASHR3 n=1 Tax=Elaeis guineensis var. tenera TaxID=51953 RepID=A0A6I9QRA9_ELAGV|nr:histone-lysine N-methyltransferase ASHR3 [Elaeis guineensis]
MPDLSNLLLPPPSPPFPSVPSSSSALLPVLQPCDPSCSSSSSRPETLDGDALDCRWSRRLRFPISTRGTCSVLKRERRGAKKASGGVLLAEHVRAWVEKKVASGVPERECFLPFLTNAPNLVDCQMCNRCIYPGEEVQCCVKGCRQAFHLMCAKQKIGLPNHKPFKCPQHGCFLCKQKFYWRCVRCTMAAHPKCAPWPEDIIYLTDRPGTLICWRHPSDWRLEKEHADPTSDVEEIFSRLPLPYVDEEYKIGSILKDVLENKNEPSPYIHIKRNIYLVKKKRDVAETGVGCTNCRAESICKDDCECRGLSISCSKACHCSDVCTNRPFRKERKIKIVKTKLCGWGVVALEAMEKGDFVIEYIGEVIDDALCEQRLWDMKHRGDRNFYMCEIRKDFTIDATFKGNASRFLNHSCNPNCKLEKWQVDGETRVGVFASRSIEVGEPLTYDYRFVHFGPMVKCYCGASNCQGYLGSKASNCQGYLGSKRKINQVASSWGCKRKRSVIATRSSSK